MEMPADDNTWKELSEHCETLGEEVHVWLAQLDWTADQLASGYDILDDDEKKRADRFIVERVRDAYVASHAILRTILAGYSGQSVKGVSYQYGEYGKPHLVDNKLISFNMSHSKGVVMIAVAKLCEIGIDVEWENSETECELLAQRFFAEGEFRQIMDGDKFMQLKNFFNCWTRKEAFLKVTGKGLSFGLKNFIVNVNAEGNDGLLSVKEDVKLAQHYFLSPIYTEPGYQAALAGVGLQKKVKYFKWLAPKS
jgi:4'-phosphopantetheinyl transferase